MTKTFTLSRQFSTGVECTPEVLALSQMFGIGVDKEHVMVLYKDLQVEIGEGKVVLIVGESGAGKSCLLRDCTAQWHLTGGLSVPIDVLNSDKPLVNCFGSIGLESACRFLSLAGLSEVNVMIRRPQELSDGQRYRLMLALAMSRAAVTPGVAFIDEFGAYLDRRTAKAVSANVRKVATRGGVGFVVATTHEDLTDDLNPDTIVRMRLMKVPSLEYKK